MIFCYEPHGNRYSIEGLIAMMHRWGRGNLQYFLGELSQSEFCLMTGIDFSRKCLGVEDVGNANLTELLHVSAPAVSRMLKNLEKRELVIRYNKGNDKRNTYIELSDQGQKLVDECRERLQVFSKQVVLDMGEEKFHEMADLFYCFNESLDHAISEMKEEENRKL